MIVSQALAAHCADPAALEAARRAAAAAEEAWLRSASGRLFDTFRGHGVNLRMSGKHLFDALLPLIRDPQWARELIGHYAETLQTSPMSLLPLTAAAGSPWPGLVIRIGTGATVLLSLIEAGRLAEMQGATEDRIVRFEAAWSATTSLHGGDLTIREYVEQEGRSACIGSRRIAAGMVVETTPGRAISIDAADKDCAILRLSVADPAMTEAREYEASTGELRLITDAHPDPARQQMLMAMLRAMAWRSAAPAMAELAHHGPPARRWQAMRECLATDGMVGWAALTEMAEGDPDPGLRRLAADTIERLRPRLMAGQAA